MTGRGLVRYFGFVGLAYVVATLGTGLTDYLTAAEVSKSKALLISGGVGLLVALLLGAIDLAKSNAGKSAAPAAARPAGGATPPRRGGAGLALTAVLLLGLCAGGGYLATTAVQAAVQKLNEFATPPWIKKGQEQGQERLAEEVSETGGPLTITVLSVEVTSQATKVRIRGANSGGEALTLPVFGRAQLTAPDRTLTPDPAAGDWPETVPADGEATGTIVFDGVLGPEVTEVRLSFSVIHGSFAAPPNIAVTIPLT
ncbi:hypothetical protein CS0771_06340 [Catellatospora sp. IY07-71]|uniref:hypothetical protein n=1 Tax=Catellatospora sp. IY07-71 TaxID=2728827 RepID=UPI001BB45675|nr:hypothetical protein [Catellatospora sp. IY07-71]BCJ71090.1 hypothetical protein CS0771_06340 [Catellatospora sp. IY07-71]